MSRDQYILCYKHTSCLTDVLSTNRFEGMDSKGYPDYHAHFSRVRISPCVRKLGKQYRDGSSILCFRR